MANDQVEGASAAVGYRHSRLALVPVLPLGLEVARERRIRGTCPWPAQYGATLDRRLGVVGLGS